MNTKVILGVSGGVDSALAASLMLEEGFDVIGVYLDLYPGAEAGAEDAKKVCDHLSIPFIHLEARKQFEKEVIHPFIQSYKEGSTPNPCVLCNEKVKFNLLFSVADEHNADYVATGHYARLEEKDGQFLIRKAYDLKKDQSYMLYRLKRENLPRLRFPLGTMENKTKVREMAKKRQLPIFQKKDSQDICFIPTGDHLAFLKGKTILTPGEFTLSTGAKLGPHKGIEAYTRGQRKGLGISHSHPLYVVDIDVKSGKVVLGKEEELFKKQAFAKELNFQKEELSLGETRKLLGKVRYSQNAYPCSITLVEEDLLQVDFHVALRAPTPGQSLVLYDGDYVYGGGILISKSST